MNSVKSCSNRCTKGPPDSASVATGLHSLSLLRAGKQWVRLTRTCNDNCIFCLDKGNLDGMPISLEEVVSVLKRGREAKATRAVLSGGEPTLHPQFAQIVREAEKLGYEHVQVITNGRMFAYKTFLQDALFAGLDEITFSIPSHQESDHDALTQTPGSYLQTMKGLKNALADRRAIVSLNIVVTKTNLPYLREMILFFFSLGVREFDLLYPRPFGAAWVHRDQIFFTKEEGLQYLEPVFKMTERKDIKIWINKFPEEYLSNFPYLRTKEEKIFEELEFRKEFAFFRQTGEPMWCFGPRCNFCFFKPTCHGILKSNGKILVEGKDES